MGRTNKGFSLLLAVILAVSSLCLLVAKPVFARTTIFPPTTETYNFSYVVSNYVVNYSIVKFSPSGGDNASGYSLIVYENYPPFPIEISFYDGTQKVTAIAPTNGYSTSSASTNYPTQITMTEVSSESAPTPPTSASPNPTPTLSRTATPSVPEFPSWTILLSLTVLVATAGLLVYHKRKAKTA